MSAETLDDCLQFGGIRRISVSSCVGTPQLCRNLLSYPCIHHASPNMLDTPALPLAHEDPHGAQEWSPIRVYGSPAIVAVHSTAGSVTVHVARLLGRGAVCRPRRVRCWRVCVLGRLRGASPDSSLALLLLQLLLLVLRQALRARAQHRPVGCTSSICLCTITTVLSLQERRLSGVCASAPSREWHLHCLTRYSASNMLL